MTEHAAERDAPRLGPAEVIPAEENERLARAECPDCGWRGKPREWWSRAQEEADRHNKKPCVIPPERTGA